MPSLQAVQRYAFLILCVSKKICHVLRLVYYFSWQRIDHTAGITTNIMPSSGQEAIPYVNTEVSI